MEKLAWLRKSTFVTKQRFKFVSLKYSHQNFPFNCLPPFTEKGVKGSPWKAPPKDNRTHFTALILAFTLESIIHRCIKGKTNVQNKPQGGVLKSVLYSVTAILDIPYLYTFIQLSSQK